MTNEQKSALDRFRRYAATVDLEGVYGESEDVALDAMEKDRIELTELALAEHPADDDEPADFGWGETVGFDWSGDGTCMVLSDGGWEVIVSGDVAMCENKRSLWIYSPTVKIGGFTSQSIRCLLDEPTRGDVRRLCVSLGFTLKEYPSNG